LLVAGAVAKARCKHAAVPDVGSSRNRRQDSDGIVRTNGAFCVDDAGLACDLCCDGICCAYLNGTDATTHPDQHWIPLRFSVISSTNITYNSFVQRKVTENLRTLNRNFAPQNLWFYAAGIDSHNDPRMVASCDTNQCSGNPECDFRSYTLPRVRGDTTGEILVVACDDLPFLGEAPLPWGAVEVHVDQYILLTAESVGNGEAFGYTFSGATRVHEMGHYLGLFHVFDKPGLCDAVGDWVDDTPSASQSASAFAPCGTNMDSCPNATGADPFRNFMNYASDACMTEFTSGQRARMNQAVRKYRPLLLAATRVPGGACPATAVVMQQCSCTNGASQLARCASGTMQPLPGTTLPPPWTRVPNAPSHSRGRGAHIQMLGAALAVCSLML
jgi:hypothetical protein